MTPSKVLLEATHSQTQHHCHKAPLTSSPGTTAQVQLHAASLEVKLLPWGEYHLEPKKATRARTWALFHSGI